jgi:predicted transcriptional regulator of viral defense system
MPVVAKKKTQLALDFVRAKGLIRPRDLIAKKIPRDHLDRLRRRGLIERVSRGLYAWPGADLGENQTLAEAAAQVPRGVICLVFRKNKGWIVTGRTPHNHANTSLVRVSEPNG